MAGSAYRVSLYSMSYRKLTFCKFEQLDRSSYSCRVLLHVAHLELQVGQFPHLRLCHSGSLPFNYHVYYVFVMLTAMHQLLSIEQFLYY